jgi:ABC-type iron transport system FetAB ATPase subunit
MSLSEILNNEKYWNAIIWLKAAGQKLYGDHFQIIDEDHEVICKLLAYFFQDELVASMFNLSLRKGILLTGPIGCGKTSLLSLMRYFEPTNSRFIVKPCRDVSFEFIREGYNTIQKYTHNSFKSFLPIVYCFDDLGAENNLKLFGNDCNVMAEVLLSRYDLFVNRKLLTHVTTNLSAGEIELIYGNRVRSRMREQFNLIAFSSVSKDKRM